MLSKCVCVYKVKFFSPALFLLSIFFISCNKKYPCNNDSALIKACNYSILVSSDYSLWTPKAYAYFSYCRDRYEIYAEPFYTNDVSNNAEDIILLGCWKSVYLHNPNIYEFYGDIKPLEKQYQSSICHLDLSFGKKHIGVLAGEIPAEDNKIFGVFELHFLWKIENATVYIQPKVIVGYDSIEAYHSGGNLEIQDISYFNKEKFIKIGKLEKFPIALIQTIPFNFNKIDISDTFLDTKYGITKLGCDVLRYKYTWIEEWGMPVLEEYVKNHPEYTVEELKKMKLYNKR